MTQTQSHTPVQRLARLAAAAADLAAAAMFATIFVTIIAQTSMRYLFGSPLSTSQELASIAFVWLIFWAAACNLPIREHVTFDIVYNMASPAVKRIFAIVCNLLFLAVFVYALPATWEYFRFLDMQYTASLRLTYQVAFFTYFVFAVAFPLRLAANLARLLGRGWQDNI